MFSYLSRLFTDPLGFIQMLLYRAPAILIALTLHELAHGYMAYKLGDPTAKMMGRLSLNPIKHLDPMGTVMLLVLGFGWAKPVPINPRNFRKPIRDDILVSLAGVTVNFILFFISVGVYIALYVHGVSNEIVMTFLQYFYSINMSLCLFNLLPIPPLDGFHVVNNLFFKGRLYIAPHIQQYSTIILLLLSFTGILGTFLDFGRNGLITFADWVYSNLFQLFGWM